jgi:hypothetical protein
VAQRTDAPRTINRDDVTLSVKFGGMRDPDGNFLGVASTSAR